MPKKTIEVETKFYTFHQNNSGGSFYGPVYVIIEARNVEEANSLAESKANVYFDSSQDCSCCGSRWDSLGSYGKGEEVPYIYDTPLEKYKEIWASSDYSAKVYFFDGSTKYYKLDRKTKMYKECDENSTEDVEESDE
jgi:hypothetical protein